MRQQFSRREVIYMPLFRNVYTGELVFSDDLVQIDTGEFTLPEMYREAVLDDALSDMELYEQVIEVETFPVFIEWCLQHKLKPSDGNALRAYYTLIEVLG